MHIRYVQCISSSLSAITDVAFPIIIAITN